MKNLLVQETIKNPLVPTRSGASFFQGFIPAAIGMSFIIGTLIFFFIMVMGAIQWITSGGDKASLESARGKITNAVAGFILLLAVFAIIKVIQDFFGIKILTLDIGPLKI
jgi:hypothetical protein